MNLMLEIELCIMGEIVVHGHSATELRRVVGFNSLSVLRGIVSGFMYLFILMLNNLFIDIFVSIYSSTFMHHIIDHACKRGFLKKSGQSSSTPLCVDCEFSFCVDFVLVVTECIRFAKYVIQPKHSFNNIRLLHLMMCIDF